MFTELGPWRPAVINGSISLLDNPYSWSKIANIVFLEQPAGVGFSYSNNISDFYSYNDEIAALDHLKTVKSFFLKFPSLLNNDFYLASESYGGHYTPQLADLILKDASIRTNFKGIMVKWILMPLISRYLTIVLVM
jgi:carboxypeptidase C (cathepsin A)